MKGQFKEWIDLRRDFEEISAQKKSFLVSTKTASLMGSWQEADSFIESPLCKKPGLMKGEKNKKLGLNIQVALIRAVSNTLQ